MTGSVPSPDTWRKVATDALRVIGRATHQDIDLAAAEKDLAQRVQALAAAEAERPEPPTFHVRPVWLDDDGLAYLPSAVDEYRAKGVNVTKQWRWGARTTRGGEVEIPESEPLVDKDHALRMAHKYADPLGAQVIIEGDDA